MADNLDIKSVHKELAKKDFIVFAGSGASIVPEWKKLLKGLHEKQPVSGVNIEELNEYDYPDYAQMFYNQFERQGNIEDYWKAIEEELTKKDEPYRTLQLGIIYTTGRIITTNFEDSFEEAFDIYFSREKKQNDCHIEILPDINKDSLEKDFCITYLHGRIDRRNIVFTTTEYTRFYSRDDEDSISKLEEYLKNIYKKRTIVFVGFSFSDRYLSKALKKIYHQLELEKKSKLIPEPEESLEENHYLHYAFLKIGDNSMLDSEIDSNLASMKVGVVRYGEHSDVVKCFERIEKSRISFERENRSGY